MTKLYVCSVCGRPIISDGVCNCPFCGAHKRYVNECLTDNRKWRCTVCNNLFSVVPKKCPICNAGPDKFVKLNKQTILHSVLNLNRVDKSNAKKALAIEVSNSAFYFCAAEKSDNDNERKLFQALGRVEHKHAEIWQAVLGLARMPKSSDGCAVSSVKNFKEAFGREDTAIKFYSQAARISENQRLKMIFIALIEIEFDHLRMSESRIKSLRLIRPR